MNRVCYVKEKQMMAEGILKELCSTIDLLADCTTLIKEYLNGEGLKDEESRKEGARPLTIPDGYAL